MLDRDPPFAGLVSTCTQDSTLSRGFGLHRDSRGRGPNEEALLSHVEVDVLPGLVCHMRAKVAACPKNTKCQQLLRVLTHDAVPDALVFSLECFLHARCDVLQP